MNSSDMANFDRQFKHQTAEVNGVSIHYVMGGEGEAVVLLHGFAQTWNDWYKVMPTLAQSYTVIAPDLRGFGKSSRPAPDYEAQSVAEDIHQLVNQLGFNQINLVAHDIAGAPAYAYAVRYPQEVRSLVAIEASVPGFDPDIGGAAGNYWHMGFHMTPDLPEQLVAGKEREYLTYFFRNFAYDKDAISADEIEQYVDDYAAPGAMHAAFEHYRAMPRAAEQNKSSFKAKLKMPVLALGSEKIMKDMPLKSWQMAAENVRGGVIPQCGHWVASECPEDLSQRLLTFFGEI